MIGTIRINVIVASLAFLFTFALSIGNNLFLTTCLKALYSFLIVFIITFGFRWVLGLLIGTTLIQGSGTHPFEQENSSSVGQSLDLITPNEDDVTREMMKSNLTSNQSAQVNDAQFSPLNPPKLVTKNNVD